MLTFEVNGGYISITIAPLFLRKIFPGILLEKSAKITRQLLPSTAPAVLLRLPHPYVTSLRNGRTRCRNALQFHSAPWDGREIAQPYRSCGLKISAPLPRFSATGRWILIAPRMRQPTPEETDTMLEV